MDTDEGQSSTPIHKIDNRIDGSIYDKSSVHKAIMTTMGQPLRSREFLITSRSEIQTFSGVRERARSRLAQMLTSAFGWGQSSLFLLFPQWAAENSDRVTPWSPIVNPSTAATRLRSY